MSGAGRGLARRAHPFTPFAVALAVVALAFVLPGPWGPLSLYLAVSILAVAAGVPGAVRAGLFVCLPLWFFLLLLHGVFGPEPAVTLGALHFSEAGLEEAAAQSGRLGAIITVSLGLYQAFDPSRFVDAVAARGGSFHAAYLLVATLQAAPRFAQRARAILDAQRTRGLSYGGSVPSRVRALRPLVVPLMLGALAEVDERAMALETRAIGAARRTPLAPPRDTAGDRLVRWGAVIAVGAAIAWGFAG